MDKQLWDLFTRFMAQAIPPLTQLRNPSLGIIQNQPLLDQQ